MARIGTTELDGKSPSLDRFKSIRRLSTDRSGHASPETARHQLYVGRDKRSQGNVLIKLSSKPGLIYQHNLINEIATLSTINRELPDSRYFPFVVEHGRLSDGRIYLAMEITVNRPAAEVWRRIGGYCAIAEWFQIPNCTITQGKDGEFGAVRSVANEVLVGKTELSYTYTQPVREGRPYNLYHGTLEARPLTATTSKLIYTLVYDNSMLPDDGAKEKDKAQRTATFTRALQNMSSVIVPVNICGFCAADSPVRARSPTIRLRVILKL